MEKNKMLFKFLIMILVIVLMSFFICNKSRAADDTVSGMVGTVKPGNLDGTEVNSFKKTLGKILGFLEVASGITAIVVIAFLGFQYIVSTPPNMKNEAKNKMLPIVIGVVLVFGAVSIAKFILGVAG